MSKILTGSSEVEYSADEIVLTAGEKSEQFYVLMEGSVVVELVQPTFSLCVQTLGPGDAFGWSSLVRGSDTMFQVRTRETCRIGCIRGTRLLALCNAEPAFGVRFLTHALEIAARRIHETEMRLSELCGISCR